MIDIVLDTFIPGDIDLGLPPASTLDFGKHIAVYGIQPDVQKYLALVETISMDKFNLPFDELEYPERLTVLNTTKVRDIRLFSQFLSHCFRAYYSNPLVLKKLNVGSVPPFPTGNLIQSESWDILEPVYERGAVFRKLN